MSDRNRQHSAMKRVVTSLAVVATVGAIIVGGTTPAVAASTPSFSVNISQTTGTGPFDGDDAPGHDSSGGNDVVRTNDLISYTVEIEYANGDGATPSANTTFGMDLAPGTYLSAIPPYCDPATSSLTPATIPDPPVPVTATSWQSLPSQRLECNVGERLPGSTRSYPLAVRVLGWVPNGTQLDPVGASVTSDEVTTAVPSEQTVDARVSAAPNWDLSKNGINVQEDSGSFTQGQAACKFDPSQTCFVMTYPILLGAPAGGKGTTALSSPIAFTDDLTPEALWGLSIADLDAYGARLVDCFRQDLDLRTPNQRIGESGGTAVNSVRDSGTIDCTQPGGPGTPVDVTIDNADTSLFTFPSEVTSPPGTTIPSSTAYAVSMQMRIEIPRETVSTYGTQVGPSSSLLTKNTFTDLDVTAIDGTPQPPSADPEWNNYRTSTPVVRRPGSFDKWFAGVPGAANNTLPSVYNPGLPIVEGPPGGYERLSGQIPAAPTQQIISLVSIAGGVSGEAQISGLGCDTWDPSLLQLMDGPVPASTLVTDGRSAQRFASGGEAAWLSGANWGSSGPAPRFDHIIEYSNGGGTAATSECSSGTWYDDPAEVPGNDPALAAQGIYTAVSRVRMWVDLPPNTGGNGATIARFSIHQRVAPDVELGEKVPNYGGVMFDMANRALDDMLDDDGLRWRYSSYEPQDHSGESGDRVIGAPAFSRIQKYVRAPGAPDYVLGGGAVPQVSGGQTVSYRLNPSLTSAADTIEYQTEVMVEDCLPAGQSLTSASPVPDVVAAASPAGAGLTCTAGETYLRWDLGLRTPNAAIDPIYVQVLVSPTVAAGTYTNSTLVTAGDEDNTNARDVAMRSSDAQTEVLQPAGIQISKTALTPYVEVNRNGEGNRDPLRWLIEFANINSPDQITNPDVIDVLPRDGEGDSDFTGDLEFVSATVVAGDDADLRLWYTSDPAVAQDPAAGSNAQGGTTVWCDAAAGGSPVWRTAGSPATSADCPAAAGEVTGVRIKKGTPADPVAFPSGAVIGVEVELMPTGNRDGDVYTNCVEGRVVGLVSSVGPHCQPEEIIGSSIGDRVWVDSDEDGIQDDGEAGYDGLTVRLVGTDSDGNAVTLTTVTDADGDYLFPDLQSGTYRVTFDPTSLADGESFTVRDAGDDDAVDSDGDPTTGITADIALGVDVDDVTVDQGVIPMVPSAEPAIEIVKYINDDDANTAPGVEVAAGSTMQIRMVVRNTGEVRLDPVVVTDDTIDAADISCPQDSLDIGEEMTCTATYPAPEPGVQHTNVAAVVGTAPDGQDVTDDDPANAFVEVTPTTPPTPGGDGLANTGGVIMGSVVAVGVALLALGVVLAVARRRRAGAGTE